MHMAGRGGRGARLLLAVAVAAVLSLSGSYSGGHALHPAWWIREHSHEVVGKFAASGPDLRCVPVSGQQVKLRKARTREVLPAGGAADLAFAAMRSALSCVVVVIAASGHKGADIVLFRVRAPPVAAV